jgi:DNA-binding XRE family transcriptional regulator
MVINPKRATQQIGMVIRARRKALFWSQNKLADQVQRCGKTISFIERAVVYSSWEDIVYILDKLGYEVIVRERPHKRAP